MGPPAVRGTRVARRLSQVLAELPLPCCGAAARRSGGGRINSLFPPYSPHSQWAGVLVVSLTCGVLSASRLAPAPPPPALELALRAWRLLAVLWGVLLMWLLLCDPRARSPRDGQEAKDPTLVHCRHGCVFIAAPRTKHCRQCDKCVEGFDHHCLWLNTCVGAHNYRPWLAFVASLCAWAFLSSGISVCGLFSALRLRSRSLAVGHRPAAFITALGSAVTAGWLLALLALHAYLIYNGLTTREWMKGLGPDAAATDASAAEPGPAEPEPHPTAATSTADAAKRGRSPARRTNSPMVPRMPSSCFARSMSMPSTPHAQDLSRLHSISRRTHSFMDEHDRGMHTDWRRYIFLSNVDTLDISPHAGRRTIQDLCL